MAAKDHVEVLRLLRKASDQPARIVKKVEIQVSKDGAYSVPFLGVDRGFSPRDVAGLLDKFSSTPFEIYLLVKTLMELNESGEVREAVTADLIEWHEGEAVDV